MTITAAAAVAILRARLGIEPTVDAGLVTADVPADRWEALGRVAHDEVGCLYFNWLSAIDWKEQGLEVVCRVENLDAGVALMLRTKLGAGETRCPSLIGLWRGADWMERECYDMFGVVFEGHPDLRRILLSDDWEGHPLRKDYAHDTPHTPYR